MRRRMLALALLTLGAGAAYSQTPGTDLSVSDRAIVSNCLADHAQEPRACIGAVARACSESMGRGADTTGVMALCAGREERAWSALLNTHAAALRQTESETQRALLDAALAQGDAWVQARCAYAASVYEGGSLARVVAAQCRAETAAERALDLHERLQARDS